MKKAFTLAEVLITLGVIGIVAALTMPALTANYRKKVVETRLAKAYSVMQQAIKLSEVDNGENGIWEAMPNDATIMDWYDKYVREYLKGDATLVQSSLMFASPRDGVKVNLPDGSAVVLHNSSSAFLVNAKDFDRCNVSNGGDCPGRDMFVFGSFKGGFRAYGTGYTEEEQRTGVNSEGEALSGSKTYGCNDSETSTRFFCTGLIEANGWKIPDDYPIGF